MSRSRRIAADSVTALGAGANANTLYRFDVHSPAGLLTPIPVTGLTAGDTLVGIDYRPAVGTLMGVAVNGDTVRTYSLVPATGAATLVGAETVNTIAGATAYGVSFATPTTADPLTDRIRLVNNLATDGVGGNANNFRLNPNDGALSGLDTDSDFSALPGGAANAPAIALAHHLRPDATIATTYAILSGGDRLVRVGGLNGSPSSNLGALQDVGLLGVDTSNNAGFDVDQAEGVGYAVLEVAGVARVFRVNLDTGAATPTAIDNRVGAGTIDFASLAIPPRPTLALTAQAYSAPEGDAATVTVTRTGSLDHPSTVRYATRTTGTSSAAGTDYGPTSGIVAFAPGVASQTFTVGTIEDSSVEPDETIDVELTDPTDADLAEVPLDATVTILNDDVAPAPPPPPPPPFGTGVPPVGLISAGAQPIDRLLAASVACSEGCRATLVLRLGRQVLGTRRVTLVNPGRRAVAFPLTRARVTLLRRLSAGPRTVLLRITGTFADADGRTSATFRLRLG